MRPLRDTRDSEVLMQWIRKPGEQSELMHLDLSHMFRSLEPKVIRTFNLMSHLPISLGYEEMDAHFD
jgi:hypothetical protein